MFVLLGRRGFFVLELDEQKLLRQYIKLDVLYDFVDGSRGRSILLSKL